VDLLLHPADGDARHRPDGRGKLSTIGHGPAFRAFVRAARRARVRFMVVGGTFRDVAIRSASTRDIDVVIVDTDRMDGEAMRAEGFAAVPGSPQAWRYRHRGRTVELEIAAIASSSAAQGPFSVAFQHAGSARIEGVRVRVPTVEDWVILKLLAAAADARRRARDLADVQWALEAYPDRVATSLSVAAIRGRLRRLYRLGGERLRDVVALLRAVPRAGK